ncbi:MAG: 3'-5' exonuclease [Treponema sp.]
MLPLPNKFIKDYRKLAALLKSGKEFTAFDTETTGLRADAARIIEIGAVKFDKDGIKERFSTLINPLQPIPPECTEVNNITDSMVKDMPDISKILPDFVDFLGKSIIIAHNARFDMAFLNAEAERSAIPLIKNHVIDTLSLCRWVYPSAGKYKQTAVAARLGIKVTQAHRAFDDALVCGNIFLRCIKDSASLQKL